MMSVQPAVRVWVFNGARNPFPSAVFREREDAEAWIRGRKLSGTLTAYPLDVPVYEWAVAEGVFTPKRPEHEAPSFVANFSSGAQDHTHYEDGRAWGDAPSADAAEARQ
jgi:hypothetical protein